MSTVNVNSILVPRLETTHAAENNEHFACFQSQNSSFAKFLRSFISVIAGEERVFRIAVQQSCFHSAAS